MWVHMNVGYLVSCMYWHATTTSCMYCNVLLVLSRVDKRYLLLYNVYYHNWKMADDPFELTWLLLILIWRLRRAYCSNDVQSTGKL